MIRRWQRYLRRKPAISAAASPDRLSRPDGKDGISGLDDRDRLAFGNDIVDLDQNRLDFACCRRRDRYFHLHRFDERNLVAIADAAAGLDRKRANAPGNFGHNLDLWHSTLRYRLAEISSGERLFVVAADCLR
ncbi:hypothetical protein M2222_002394 [Bradyrhizobium elkanii]|nr:hypothetical protein [Bradyrhizobium elkanii]MCS3560072.1 hypothetical protein [Bradyrhizobium elkanii]MCW2150081.1 hypothetical protein [Bradyrhizobium elkanii]MCW2359945.1 hypothetical protein [Bradyrhizobium elkanii]MCW2373813.1 hypothetical protein [Bradyrhizobium elkanii]